MIDSPGYQLGVEAAARLARLGCCDIEPGLTDREFDRIEKEFGFEFADDHRGFLATGLPVRSPEEEGATWSRPWPDWRMGDHDALRYHLDWAINFILERVEAGAWDRRWGVRPHGDKVALTAARQVLAAAPRMVPIYAHRFMPSGRGNSGRPVLSMWGWDVIIYGNDLLDYIGHEFEAVELDAPDYQKLRPMLPSFWRDYLPPEWDRGRLAREAS